MAKCDSPIVINGNQVPCSSCLNCKKTRVSGWSFRLMKEAETSVSAFFLTLTYNTDHVPITPKGYMTLERTHVPSFLKRLRQAHFRKYGKLYKTIKPIKYYAAGEYGDTYKRPHYHIILLNADKDLIDQSWTLGEVHHGELTIASVGYTLKYVNKGKRIPEHKNDDRIKEFSLMSKGIGKNYLTDQKINWHKDNITERMYINLTDGKKIPMPRYYKEKIYTKGQRLYISQSIANKEQQDIINTKPADRILQLQKQNRILLNNQRKANKDDRNTSH